MEEYKKHYLLPSALFASDEPYIVSTVLGSCVAVMLYDSKLKIGGINHYMLPLWNGEGLATPKYGNISIELLIKKMISLGASKKRLQAKLFGGATLHGNPRGLLDIGSRNIEIAKSMLIEHNIKVLASDVGGNRGRKIFYQTDTFKIKMRIIDKTLADVDENDKSTNSRRFGSR